MLVNDLEGGSSLFLDCGDGTVAKVIESATSLTPVKGEAGEWSMFEIGYDGDRAVTIAGIRYRLEMLPFAADANVQPIIAFDGTRYAIDVPLCEGLGIRAPRYADIQYEDDLDRRVETLTVQVGGKVITIRSDVQEEYNLGSTQSLDANADGIEDLIITYSDRYGSGREQVGALMLGCMDGGYVVSGSIPLAIDSQGVKAVEGGLMTERATLPDPNDPFTTKHVFLGYRIDPVTLGLHKIVENEEREVAAKILAVRSQE